MSKRIRQYVAITASVIAYYLVHEGAHLLYALSIGVLKQVNFLGLGIQVDVFRERMTDGQLGWFCLMGALATLAAAYLMTALTPQFCKVSSKLFRAVTYYVTITFLILDPIYLSILCGLFGGGDMNGIALLVPEGIARGSFVLLLLLNLWVLRKKIYPAYKASFA